MKRINITPRMLEAMRVSMDDSELSADAFVVFETVAVTSRPLDKSGTIFNGGIILESTLQEMADVVNSQGGAVPIIMQHNRGGADVSPMGKVFEGAVYPTDDGLYHELRTLFAMPNPETDTNKDRATLTKDIDNGLLSEVSIGAAFKQLLSSANPQFDFLGEDADIMNFIERKDDEGNSIDAGETHVIAKGLRSWAELSLVVRGASSGATISSTGKQKLSKKYEDSSMFRKLAASSDFDAAQLVTFTSSLSAKEVETPKDGDFDMDAKDILAQLSKAGAEVGQLTAKLEAETTKVTELTASNTQLTTDLDAANTAKDTAETRVTELEAQFEDAPADSLAEVKLVNDFIDSQVTAAATAAGKSDVDVAKMSASEKIAFIKKTGVNLHQTVGAGGTGKAKDKEDNATATLSASQKAFLKANRRAAQ